MPEKEEKSVNEKTKKKGVKTAAAVVVLLVLCCLIGIGIRSVQKRQTYENHIAAAEKYLVDLNYEQAIVEYTLALEIEPNEPALLDALEQTYLDYAQSLADAGDYEGAIAVLEEGAALEIKPDGTALPDALEQTYLDYAQSLAAAEDYEKSIAVLAEGSAKTGRESLQTTEKEYEELKAQKEEEERLAAEAAKKAEAEKEEKKKEAEELIADKWIYFLNVRKCWQCGISFIPDAQVMESCEQAAALLEPYFAGEFGPVADSADNPYYLPGLKCLADAYYLLGKKDLCLEKRRQIYEACGSPAVENYTPSIPIPYYWRANRFFGDWLTKKAEDYPLSDNTLSCDDYIPIEHTETVSGEYEDAVYMVDEYGAVLSMQSQDTMQGGNEDAFDKADFNEQGKRISETSVWGYEYKHEYDPDGRISKCECVGGFDQTVLSVEYHEGGNIRIYMDRGQSQWINDYEIGEDGCIRLLNGQYSFGF